MRNNKTDFMLMFLALLFMIVVVMGTLGCTSIPNGTKSVNKSETVTIKNPYKKNKTREVQRKPTMTPVPTVIPVEEEVDEEVKEVTQASTSVSTISEAVEESIVEEVVEATELVQEVQYSDNYYEEELPPPAEVLEESPMTYLGAYTVTFYCNCEQCCGRWAGGGTASGTTPQAGWTVATSDSIPFGTTLYIEGIGYRTVEDRGVPDGWVDVYVNSHDEIPSWGMTSLNVYRVN